MSKKKLTIIAFIFCGFAIIFLLSVIILPIILKSNIKSTYREKTTPNLDNTNLWARFPGEIKSKTTHTFNILDYSQKNPKFKDSLVLEEKTSYENFTFKSEENKLVFDARSNYSVTNKPNNESINTFSLGMFETFEAFSNPMKYQDGINSLGYLLKKVFNEPDLFIKKVFSYNISKNLSEEDKRTLILKNISKEKADMILSDDEKYAEYSFKKCNGFYKWVKLLGLPKEIKNAIWLYTLFNLTKDEIHSILGENEYLYTTYLEYNKELSKTYGCLDQKFCGNEIIYKQLLSGDVIKSLGLEKGIKSLYEHIGPEYYPFSDSPELFLYFEKYNETKIQKEEVKYKDYSPDLNQLTSMIDLSSNLCLLSSNNSVLFLTLNKTKNYNKANEIFKISENTTRFISDYLYEFLPNLFLDKNSDNFAKGFLTITQGVMENTFKLLKKKQIYNLFLSKIAWTKLLEKISSMTKSNLKQSEESDEVCPIIMQRALDDGKKVLKVCSNPKTSFYSYDTLQKWLGPYFCSKDPKNSKCDMNVINDLKSIIYISDTEIQNIYDPDLLGGILEEKDKELQELYQCGDDCNEDYVSKVQFWKGLLSKNAPFPLNKSNTISAIFPNIFPYPVEISYFAEILGETDEIKEDDINELISLCPKGDNILNEESSEALETKIRLEKDYTLIINKKKEYESKYKVFNILNNGYLFNNETNTKYKNIYSILEGNCDEDNRYIKFLSSGTFYENYKPKLNKTTGFNFGIDFNNEEEKENLYDRYEIYAKQDDKDMRKILTINDIPVLNIKKLEYNSLLNDNSIIESPTMNFQTLTGDKSFIDGFQYDVEDEDEPIYFYDKISSRPFKFNFDDDFEYKDINCQLYKLDKDDLANNINEENDSKYNKAFLTQKLNKPFVVSVGNDNLALKIDENFSEDNYICIDPFTNMVLDSKINLVYSLYTKNYGYINPSIENDKNYPIFVYSRNFEVDIDSYKDYFPNITSFYTFRLIFIIVGVILFFICAVISLWAFLKLHKTLLEEDINRNIPEEKLLENSRITGTKNE